jgi:SAM-dependent methyltransferase
MKRKLLNLLDRAITRTTTALAYQRYIRGDRTPWSPGYLAFRQRFIQAQLSTNNPIAQLDHTGYGIGLDERVVEYPWLFSHLSSASTHLLDAGSTFNFDIILDQPILAHKNVTIFTLAPEPRCYWERGVSYQFGDLRDLPYRDGWFDEIVCISTLEHVGMDNRNYGADTSTHEENSYIQAVNELNRALKPGGKLYITVPYGKYQLVKWGDTIFMQQFDENLLHKLTTSQTDIQFEITYYQYTANGWHKSDAESLKDIAYFNIHAGEGDAPDKAAAARGIACLIGTKVNA